MNVRNVLLRLGKCLVGFFTGAVVLQTAASASVEDTVACPDAAPESDGVPADACSEAA